MERIGVSNDDLPDLFPQLPALAARLGVKPGSGDGNVWLIMKDGSKYDLFVLINAVLNRLDASTK